MHTDLPSEVLVFKDFEAHCSEARGDFERRLMRLNCPRGFGKLGRVVPALMLRRDGVDGVNRRKSYARGHSM